MYERRDFLLQHDTAVRGGGGCSSTERRGRNDHNDSADLATGRRSSLDAAWRHVPVTCSITAPGLAGADDGSDRSQKATKDRLLVR